MKKTCEIGMVGLGVMGRNLLLNMIDHGFSVTGYDNNPDQVQILNEESQKQIHATTDIKEFIAALRQPRAIMLLVPAGRTVDSVIQNLLPHLKSGDLVIDAGNSYFKDTDIRIAYLATKGIQFMGVGISGGEKGARYGPSIMPGGPKAAYDHISLILKAISAKVNNEPCEAYLGPGSAGHFVKMVHNGIEYGIMQLISETYDLMKRGLNFKDNQIRDIYSDWNRGELKSYLIEITSQIFEKIDEKTGKRLINQILDVAKQNGTGMWTSQSAMELKVPTPTIDIAVAMRNLSVFKIERKQAQVRYQNILEPYIIEHKLFTTQLGHALYVAMLITYAQGMVLLKVASKHYQYDLDLKAVAQLWRGGCIIRAALLDDISTAFHINKNISNLLLDPGLSQKLMKNQGALRQIVRQAADLGIPTPGLMASLSYFDAYRSLHLPTNLIQAQRDYFGAHRYERIDMKGTFHTQWGGK